MMPRGVRWEAEHEDMYIIDTARNLVRVPFR